MWNRALFTRGLSLSSLGIIDFGTPLIRAIALTHLLGLREFGFASALAATYATYEQITDMSIHRFVFASPREQFEPALAGAHALSILRGLTVGAIAIAAAPAIAAALSLEADWVSFAALAPIIFIRSLEHQAIRVAERDYRYGRQFLASFLSNVAGLTVLVAAAAIWRSHFALLASLFVQMLTSVAMTRGLADTPYRFDFRSSHFRRSWRFGYPLMFNGVGLAISTQGDRLIVGALLGLPALAIYSVLLLVAYVPIGIILKTSGTVGLAALHNACMSSEKYTSRLRLYATAIPLVAGFYAVGLLAFANILISFVFGAKFGVSDWAVILLALSSFLKIARSEPFTAMFLEEMKTGTLATANLAAVSGLAASVGSILIFRTFEAPLIGKTIGECLGLFVSMLLSGKAFRAALSRSLGSISLGLLTIVVSGALVLEIPSAASPWWRLLGIAASCIPLFVLGSWRIPELFRESYAVGGLSPLNEKTVDEEQLGLDRIQDAVSGGRTGH
jgi:O-antigen/teichoic acid export membrane protein